MDIPIIIKDLDTTQYQCYICTQTLNTIVDLKIHTLLKHPEIFNESTTNVVQLHKCKKCNKRFQYRKCLLRHYRHKHS